MKKILRQECMVCDVCRDEKANYNCDHCKKDLCYDCRETDAVVMHYTPKTGSSFYDGTYCKDCYKKLSETGQDALFNLYKEVERLTIEYIEWKKKFNFRAKEVEKWIKVYKDRRRTNGNG